MINSGQINMRIEYDPAPIRHIAVQRPKCNNWFHGRQITSDRLDYEYQLDRAVFTCPVCHDDFGFGGRRFVPVVNAAEVGFPEIYEDCIDLTAEPYGGVEK